MSVLTSLRGTTPAERRLFAARLFQRMSFDSCYFVGIIGGATYVLGADAYGVAGLVFVLNIVLAVSSAVAGVAIDRVGPRHAIIVALVALFVTGVASQLVDLSFASLLVVEILFGAVAGVADTAFRSFPPFLVTGREELAVSNSLLETATNLAIVAGPLLGGAIVSFFPLQRVFLVLVFASAASLASIWGCREVVCPVDGNAATSGDATTSNDPTASDDPTTSGASRFLSELRDGARTALASRDLRILLLVGFLGFFAFGAFDSLESLFYRDVLRVGTAWMGWLSAIMGVGCVLGSVAMMRIPARAISLRLLVVTLLVVGLGAMIYVGTDNVWIAAAGQLVLGSGFGLLMPLQNVLVQEDCDLAYLGRVMSVKAVVLQSAGILPLIVAPFLADAFGVQAVLFGASTFVAFVATAFLVAGHLGRRDAS